MRTGGDPCSVKNSSVESKKGIVQARSKLSPVGFVLEKSSPHDPPSIGRGKHNLNLF